MAASENGKTVTVLGMGLMGAPMAVRLAEVGYDVTVWNRTVEKSQAVQGGNANIAIASSAAEAIAASPVNLTKLLLRAKR